MSLKIDRIQLEIIINNDQARKQLRALEDEARQLTKDMSKLDKTSAEYAQGAKRLQSIKIQMDNIYDSIGLANLNMKELRKRQADLNAILNNMSPSLKGYKELKEQAVAVSNRIAELNGKAQATGLSIGKIADNFNRYFAFVTAGLASLTGLIFSLRKVIDVANLFEKRVDNLSALTGLLGDDLAWLSEEAKKLSTSVIEGNVRISSSATEIVDAYTKVGSKRPELLKVKEDLNSVTKEAMILAAAANGDLEPAVNGLTMVLNQFNAPASESRRIINVLAAGSKEGAGEIDYLTAGFEKSGSVASSFGISVEELTGVLETLAPRISEPEMAGRSLRNIMIKLETQTNDNLKPSIVGLGKAFEYLHEKQWSVTQLNELFGTENINAANILMNNTAETKKYTAAVTGTNVALEQAAINTDNNTTKLAQAKNRVEVLSIEFGKKLAPAMTFSTNAFAAFMRVAMAAPGFIRQYQIALISLAGAMLVYNAGLVKSIGLKVTNHLLLKEGIGLKIKDAVVTAALAVKEQLLTIWKGNGTVATKLATTAQYAWNAALNANPIGLAITAITALVVAVKSYDQLSAESVRLEKEKADAVNHLTRANELLKKAYDIQEEKISTLNKLSIIQKRELQEQVDATLKQAEAELVLAQAKQKNIEKDNTRTTLWQSLKNALISGNNPAVAAARNATDAVLNGVEASKAMDDGIKELTGSIKQLRGQSSGLNEIVNAEKFADQITGHAVAQLEEKQRYLTTALKNYEKGSADYTRIAKKIAAVNKEIGSDGGGGVDDKDKAAKAAKTAKDAYKTQLEIEKKARDSAIALMQEGYQKELDQLHAAYADQREATLHELTTNSKLTIAEKESLNATLKNLDQKYVSDYNKLAADQAIKELQFDKQLTDLKLSGVREGSSGEYQLKKQSLDQQLQIEIAQVTGTEEQKQQLILAIKEKYAKLQADQDEKYSLKFLDDDLKQQVTKLAESEQGKLKVLKQKREAGQISQREYNKELKNIQLEYTKESLQIALDKAEKELAIIKAAGGDITQAEEALAAIRLKLQEAGTGAATGKGSDWKDWSNADKGKFAIDQAKSIADAEFRISADKNQRILDDKLSQLASEKDAELSNKNLTEQQKDSINKKYADKEKAIKTAAWEKQHKADLAQAWVNLALMVGKAAINTWPIPAIPMMAAAAIEGGIQIATISSQKPPQFYAGGYTPDGDPNQPAGIVHKNEFVANAKAVENPTIKPVLDIIDKAQQDGTVKNIDLPAAAAAVETLYATSRKQPSQPAPQSPNAVGTFGQSPGNVIPSGVEGAVETFGRTSQNQTVTGARDNKQYTDIPYINNPETNVYTHPSLIADHGSEIIIDHIRTRNIMMNYPEILAAIKAVPQHYSGRYPDVPATGGDGRQSVPFGSTTNPPPSPSGSLSLSAVEGGGEAFISALTRFSDTVEKLQKDGVRGVWVYQDFKLFDDKVNQANTLTN